MDFCIVLACDESYGIGKDGNLPWKIREDMQFFKELTSQPNTALLIGRCTADSFTKPLPNRINVVISSNTQYRRTENFKVFTTIDLALVTLSEEVEKIFIIGGAQLAEEAIKHPRCRTVYLNKIHKNYNCDVSLSCKFIDKLSSTFEKTEKTDMAKDKEEHVAISYMKFTYVNKPELKFISIIERVFTTGLVKETRNAKTISKFFDFVEFDMADGFPLLTTKQVFIRGILEELCFFLRGDTNAKHLHDKRVNIWDKNTSQKFLDANNRSDLKEWDMGQLYGYQWRFFNAKYTDCHADYKGKGIDQLQDLIDTIVVDPSSRRLLMTTYNPEQAKHGVLFPCHSLITQCAIEDGNRLSMIMFQRSCDLLIGGPFNIASTAALLHIITMLVNNHPKRTHIEDYIPGRVIIIFGDHHIYIDKDQGDHTEAIKELLTRKTYPFPSFKIKKKLSTLDDLVNLGASDFEISNYICGSTIKAKMVA